MESVGSGPMVQGASDLNDSAEKKSAFHSSSWKVSTMVNPDGSVTIRRKVMNPDGSFTLKDELKGEEDPSPEMQKSELPTLQLSDSSDISSITDMRTLSLMSTSSSKEDVFAGIEESPRRSSQAPAPVLFEESEINNSEQEAGMEIEQNKPLQTTPQMRSTVGTATLHSTPSPVYEWDFQKLRDTGPLVDTKSVEGFAEKIHPITVSIFKKHLDDKIGINVGLERIGFRDRLIVTKIAENGLFAEQTIEEGDIVASINSHDFLEAPDTEDALAIVITTVGKITFVLYKRGKTGDISIASPPRVRTQKGVGAVTRGFLVGDGGRTRVVDQFNDGGKQVNREIRRELPDAANGRMLDMIGDNLASSGALRTKPGSEKKIVVRKMDKSQKIGLKLEELQSASDKSLFIAGIHPSGLLAKSQEGSLVLGDIIVKINGFDFRENPILEIANSIIRNSVGDITIIATGAARMSPESGDFSRNGLENDGEFAFIANIESKAASVDFDENSYGGSIGSYVSSKLLRVSKDNPSDSVGFGMMTQLTKWGPMLVVSEMLDKGLQTELKVGDAILAINGINFRGKPDPDRANSVLQKATKVIVVEYQRLSEMKSSLSLSGSAEMERDRRRANRSGEKRRSTRIEEFDASFRTKVNPSKSVEGDVVTSENYSISPERLPRTSVGTPPMHHQAVSTRIVQPKDGSFFVNVSKEHPKQEVGITFEAVNGILFVSTISPDGILVGQNVVPGDVIFSINNESFTEAGTAREAEALISNSKVLILEVKTRNQATYNDPTSEQKLKWHEKLQCRKRMGESL